MADNGIVAVWMDPDRDRDNVVVAALRAFPDHVLNFLNTRYFTDVESVGADRNKLRGYVLATGIRAIHEAHEAAGLKYLDLTSSPLRERAVPECVVVYLAANDNEMNDTIRAQARSSYPATPVRSVDAVPFNGPEVGNIVAVFVPETAPQIAKAYVALRKLTVMVSRPSVDGASGVAAGIKSGVVDPSVIAATLALEMPNFTGVIKSQTDVVWLTALSDMEAANNNREDVHRALNDRLVSLGSLNQHYRAGMDNDVKDAESTTDATEPPADDPNRDMSFISTKTVKEALALVQSIDDVETLQAIYDSEEAGRGRSTILSAALKRVDALA